MSKADDFALAELARLVPAYEDLAPVSKVHLLQSVVSRILVEMVFDAYFAGLPPERTAQFKEIEAFLSSYGRTYSLRFLLCRLTRRKRRGRQNVKVWLGRELSTAQLIPISK